MGRGSDNLKNTMVLSGLSEYSPQLLCIRCVGSQKLILDVVLYINTIAGA